MVDRTAQSESRDHQSADEHYEGARRVRQDRHGQKARPDPLHRQKPRRAQDEKGQHKLQVWKCLRQDSPLQAHAIYADAHSCRRTASPRSDYFPARS